jgi:hypothetical protein
LLALLTDLKLNAAGFVLEGEDEMFPRLTKATSNNTLDQQMCHRILQVSGTVVANKWEGRAHHG